MLFYMLKKKDFELILFNSRNYSSNSNLSPNIDIEIPIRQNLAIKLLREISTYVCFHEIFGDDDVTVLYLNYAQTLVFPH